MPIYEYSCENCGYEIEVFQGVNEPLLTLCEKCGKSTLTKLVSAAGFRLKGSGWYETDFKKDDKKKNLSSAETTPAPSPTKEGKDTQCSNTKE
jgi:putative FmdB family regulatory protein